MIEKLGLTEDGGNEKPVTGSLDSNSASKLSSNKRSHRHVRKNARPTRARVAAKRQANNFLAESFNNNSDEEVVELVQPQSMVNSSLFNHLPPPPKRLSLLGTSNITEHGAEGKSNVTELM